MMTALHRKNIIIISHGIYSVVGNHVVELETGWMN